MVIDPSLLRFGFLIGLLIVLNMPYSPVHAGNSVGKLVFAHGDVDIRRSESAVDWQPAVNGMPLEQGNTIRVGKSGQAALLLNDESLVRLHSNSVLTINGTARPQSADSNASATSGWSQYLLRRGTLWLRNNLPGAAIQIDTPTAILGIRGTEVGVNLEDKSLGTHVAVIEGQVLARNEVGEATAGTGERLTVRPGTPPTREVLLAPKKSVQWTLRIPDLPLSDHLPLSLSEAYRDLLDGRVTQAQTFLATYLKSNSEDFVGWSLLAISHLVLDELSEAEASAQQAVRLAPDSALGWLINAYVAQANHDLPKAEDDYSKALDLAPDQLEARIGRAEIRFGSERNEEAWADMEHARHSAPENPRIDSLRGYLLLARGDIRGALSLFERALSHDPSLSDAWLGKSIANMRTGQTETAFEAMSAAILAEPRKALLLTYWGRMLYQAGRLDRALTVLESAIRSDPNDPTGWFIKAFILRDLRRYNEAFESMRNAIALNDNRAVYRSRYLLDQDLAFRSTSLAYLFNDLGLSAWAEKKALESIKQDYLNFSGHLFYAGALLNREGRSRVGASEQILSLLLQPASINTFNSFNDYTTFYEQPGLHGQVTAGMGNLGRKSGNISTYGSLPESQIAYQLYAGNSSEDGWRADQRQSSHNRAATIKWQASEKDNLTISLREVANRALGDASRRGEFESPLMAEEKNRYQQQFLDIGHHRRIDATSSLLTLFSATKYDSRGEGKTRFPYDEGIDIEELRRAQNPQSAQQLQVQHIARFERNQLITGILLYNGRKKTDTRYDYSVLIDGQYYPLPEAGSRTHAAADESYQSLYAQGIWQLTTAVGLDYGLYFERIKRANLFTGGRVEQQEVTPRLGLIWRPTQTDTFRVARFKYLVPLPFKRLDPGEIAGIPISRNTYNGTLASEVSLAYEKEWQSGLVSINLFDSTSRSREGFSDTSGGQSYVNYDAALRGMETELNWLVGTNLGLAGRYRALNVKNASFPDLDRQENLVSVSIHKVFEAGYRLSVAQSQRRINFYSNRHSENTALTDASFGYELPQKRGYLGIEVRNLFNRRFNWVVDPFVFAVRIPAREVGLTLTLNY